MKVLEQEAELRRLALLDSDSAIDIRGFKRVESLIRWLKQDEVRETNRRRIEIILETPKHGTLAQWQRELDYLISYYEYHLCRCFEEKIRAKQPRKGWVLLKYPAGPIFDVGWDKDDILEAFSEECSCGCCDILEYHERHLEYEPTIIMQATEKLVEWVQYNGATEAFKIENGICDLRKSQ